MSDFLGKSRIANAAAIKTNVGSFGTRIRYWNAFDRFCLFCEKEFHCQKVQNISAKHVYAYVEKLKSKGASPATIRTELCGIRFFYKICGGKNKLPENKSLKLLPREIGVVNRAWLVAEINKAIAVADAMGRTDVVFGIRIGWRFGLRIHEIAKLRVEDVTRAVTRGELCVKGKGGYVRSIPVETPQQKKLLSDLYKYARMNNLEPGDCLISENKYRGIDKEIKSLKNWVINNRKKFTYRNRTKFVGENEKPRMETLTWHGLRYTYAQERKQRLIDSGVKDVDRNLSESLGHHRVSVTKIYTAEKKHK